MGYSVSQSSSLNVTTFLLMTREHSKYNCPIYFISTKDKPVAKKDPLLGMNSLTQWLDFSLLLVQCKSGVAQ